MNSHKQWLRNAAMLLMGCLLMGAGPTALSADDDESLRALRSPVGTWLLDVTFPPAAMVPPFKEFLVFHRSGTLTESNTTLHANSANPFFNFNGSDGYGTWQMRRGRVEFVFHKLVFDGDTNEHVGYLRVRSTATINGNTFTSSVADSQVDLIMGTDLASGTVVPFGGSDATGTRIGLN